MTPGKPIRITERWVSLMPRVISQLKGNDDTVRLLAEDCLMQLAYDVDTYNASIAGE